MRRRYIFFLLVLMAICASQGLSADNVPATEIDVAIVNPPPPPSTNSVTEDDPFYSLMFETIALLAVVLIIFWLTHRFRNRFSNSFGGKKKDPMRLQIRERISLGGRYHIIVIGYQGQQVMVGLSPTGISHIKDLSTGPQEGGETGSSSPENKD